MKNKINSLVIHFVVYIDGMMVGTEPIAINTTEADSDTAIENCNIVLRKKYEKEHPGAEVVVAWKPHS